jgi:hypothetical protein
MTLMVAFDAHRGTSAISFSSETGLNAWRFSEQNQGCALQVAAGDFDAGAFGPLFGETRRILGAGS